MKYGVDAHAPDLDPNRPLPIRWEEYSPWLRQQWTNLLDSDPAEREVQEFLESNPCLLPGASSGYRGGTHGPYGVVFAESELQGVGGNFKPDFMWITGNSAKVHPVMIEIEAPSRSYFTKSGEFTADFNHALRQLGDWRKWWSHPENQLSFRSTFLEPIWDFRNRMIEPRYILIYGRSREFQGHPELNRLRAGTCSSDQDIMSFDRLEPNWDLSDIACVQRTSARARLRTVPSTFTTGPPTMHFARWIDKPDPRVFAAPQLWDAARAAHVAARFNYWQNLGETGFRGPHEMRCGE